MTPTPEPTLTPRRRTPAPVYWLLALLLLGARVGMANGPASDAADPAETVVPTETAGATGEQADCAMEAARRVQAHYESVRDLRADFAQTTESVALGTGALAASASTAGEVHFAKPGRMRWHYRAPLESLVVTDGEILWIYDPAAREAQRLPVTGDYLSGAALQFLIGEGDLAADFEISSPDCAADPLQLDLLPREDATYERLALTADRTTGAVKGTSIVDLFGNVTRVRFSEVRTNLDPPVERFRFEPPEGVRVTDLTP